uniref:EC54 protein n=1 Tax=Colletotrichum higginsianum TaxID=80884 RepID=I2G7D4_9PEZI|nr:EC54 protein [Colletotrichum higginsianum]
MGGCFLLSFHFSLLLFFAHLLGKEQSPNEKHAFWSPQVLLVVTAHLVFSGSDHGRIKPHVVEWEGWLAACSQAGVAEP